ncbi:MAG: HAD superfamily hydrolase [Parcubacteria group bacterium GW2011_GWA2_47_16]|nr:MAG: HAD superfamily hydrolase [Parcubacteria group bacterium GW2011_GWA2_47_16]
MPVPTRSRLFSLEKLWHSYRVKKTNGKKLIVFDLDGTLYPLVGGSYDGSLLKRRVLANAIKFISEKLSKSKAGARTVLETVQKKYREQISIGLEKEYGLSRYDYFNTVWDIPTRGIVKKNPDLRKVLLELQKTYELALVSDAPQVWIKNVLTALSVEDIFRTSVFSGEGGRRKGFGNAFLAVVQKYKIRPADCVAVGDQEETDILPAKKLGMRTIFVHPTKLSLVADVNIKSIGELVATLKFLS